MFSKIQFKGTSVVNLLGKDGDFEKDSNNDGLADGWKRDGFSSVLINSNSVYGSKSQQVEGKGNIIKDVDLDSSKHYLVSAYCNITSYTDGSCSIFISDKGNYSNITDIVNFDTAKTNQWQRKGIKFAGRNGARI